jgi:maltose O-acetyltransferase
MLVDSALIEIGDHSIFGPGVSVYCHNHPVDSQSRLPFLGRLHGNMMECTSSPVKIGRNCWIGGGSTICPGIRIGDNCIVAGGSVVVKNVESNVVIGGNPAKILKRLDGEVIVP